MKSVMNFIFNNIFLILFLAAIFYIIEQYKDLKNKASDMQNIFDVTLTKYLNERIEKANAIADHIEKNYGHIEIIAQEINRLRASIEKNSSPNINDKIEASNAINKFKLNKKIDLEKYPDLDELNKIGTFTEEDMSSLDNGIAIARREYNASAFRYNEKSSSFPMQYLVKILRLTPSYKIFDAPKSNAYEENYEVFVEEEPEINSLSSLNLTREELEREEATKNLENEEVQIEHTENVIKPSTDINKEK